MEYAKLISTTDTTSVKGFVTCAESGDKKVGVSFQNYPSFIEEKEQYNNIVNHCTSPLHPVDTVIRAIPNSFH